MCGEERGGPGKAMGRRREERRQEWVEDEAGGGKAMRVRGGRCGTGHGERRRNREGTGDGWAWRRDNRKIDATCTKRLFQCVSARLDFFSRFFKGCKKQKPCICASSHLGQARVLGPTFVPSHHARHYRIISHRIVINGCVVKASSTTST